MTKNLNFGILGSKPIQLMFGYRPPGTSRIKEGSASEKEEEKEIKGAPTDDHEEEGTSRWEEEDCWDGWKEGLHGKLQLSLLWYSIQS
jgi:hypothetical protein